jgi:hypothetical protein
MKRNISPRFAATTALALAAILVSQGKIASYDHAIAGLRSFGPVYPRLSHDGETIAFSYQGTIWRLPRAGGVMTRLTAGDDFDIEPAWSPEGSTIAYINSKNYQDGSLRIIRTDDGSAVPLPIEVLARGKLEFDPTGQRILGVFQTPEQRSRLSWLDLASGQLSPVGPSQPRPRCHALSHDGRWIAWSTTLDRAEEQGGNNGPEVDLWKLPAEGGEPEKVVRFPARIHDMCWAADGQSLYVATELGGVHNDLWQVPLAEPLSKARKLTSGQADEDRPTTSHDGRWLLFTDNRAGATALVLRDQAGDKEEILTVSGRDFRRPTGRLELRVRDKSDSTYLTARVAIRHSDGSYHAPLGSLYRLFRGELHFYAGLEAQIELPEGRYQLKAARGPEYRVSRMEFEIQPARTTTLAVDMERWTHQEARGWYSGESHIHANYGYGHWYNSPETMLRQCSGEDLRVGNFMVANSDGDGVFDREFFRGRPDALSNDQIVLYWNQEFRSTIWGHMTLLNLRQLVEPIFTGFSHTTHSWDVPTNADIGDLTHDQGGFVNYTHPANDIKDPYVTPYSAKELPVDVALGTVDSIDVMGTGHEANLPLWYRLLNCGFRIPASAGTDCFLNRIPSKLPGSDRAYVRIDGPFSYQAWIEGLKAGRTFVTSGPMFVEYTVSGRSLGETVHAEPGTDLHVRGRAISQYPLDRLEVVYNGDVVATAQPAGDNPEISIDQEIPINQGGWIALRVSGPRHPDHPTGSVYAHTSPIYINVPGHFARAREDAEYFLAWIDRLEGDVSRRDRIPSRQKAHVVSQLSAAREVFKAIALKACL